MTLAAAVLRPPIGERIPRVEDSQLVRGAARYVADYEVEGLLHVVFVRSPIAHARITRIDTTAAAMAPGVVAVLTGPELGLPPVYLAMLAAVIPETFREPAIALDVVRFVGEPVAVVIADSLPLAVDAAAMVEIDFDPLPVVIDGDAAVADDSPLLFPAFGTNVVATFEMEAGECPHDEAVMVELVTRSQRVAVAPMEPNACTAIPDPEAGTVTLWASTQSPHGLRDSITGLLGWQQEELRVICPSVGGGFGGKPAVEAQYLVLAALARRIGRPLRYVESRSDNLVMMQGRGQSHRVKLGATADGRLTSLRVDVIADCGAYPSSAVALTMTTRSLATGVYRIPYVHYRIRPVATNKAPIRAFRGAGRPEAAMLLERSMDLLAAELEMDPVELRRRNLLTPDQFPYQSLTGGAYDSGNYGPALDEALRLSRYGQTREEQRKRRASGATKALGIGLAMYVEISAGHESQRDEYASVAVNEDGTVTIVAGTSSHGQGHATTYAQIVSASLGVPVSAVRFVDGDTGTVPRGTGTQGSRSTQIGGSAVSLAAVAVLEKARQLAAHLLEATTEDIVVAADGGGLAVAGVPSSALSWSALAAAANDPARLPHGMEPGLVESPGFIQSGGTAPFGCHVAVVEVDLETGQVQLQRMVAVDDCGTMISPLLVEGQVHGGLASGIGQALYEDVQYDKVGNPVTSTFADYALPGAADLPSFVTGHTTTPTSLNPLGAKGVGEAGTTGSIPAVQNAVIDALAHLGVRNIDLPLTPERVWCALRDAGAIR